MNQPSYMPGERVEFLARGRTLIGTITRTRLSQRRGKARELARLVTGDAGSLDRMVAEIVPDGQAGVWTVPLGAIKQSLGRASDAEQRAAHVAVTGIKSAHAERKSRQRHANNDAIEAAGFDLWSLAIGELIEVQFRDSGWQQVEFAGIVSGSGNVRFRHRGRTRSVSAKFVRKAQVQQ